MKMSSNEALENMMGKLGEFGKYQGFQFMLHALSALPAGVHMLSLVTITGVPDHRCVVPGEDVNNTMPWNSTFISEVIPKNALNNSDSCQIYGHNGSLTKCQSWTYDTQYYTSSRGMDWDFVCDRRWMGAVAQSVFMSGVILGSIFLVPLCDKIGRKPVFCISTICQLLSTIAVAFTTKYVSFVIMRFICGIFAISPFKTAYVLFIELLAPNKRNIGTAIFQLLFAVGVMLVGVWGYLIDNSFYLQIVYALHTVILLPHIFLMDESPRWLWAKGRIQKSMAVARRALKMNKSREKIESPLLEPNLKSVHLKMVLDNSSSLIGLFKTPNLRRKTLIICGAWFASAVVHNGLSLKSGKLNGNPFIMLIISGFMELPGAIISMYFVTKFGNRTVLSGTMIISGISLISILTLPSNSSESTAAFMVGKFLISGTYAIIYKYAAELFPTVVRGSGIGFGIMCGSVASALTPLLALLDSFDPVVPTTVFGIVSLFFGCCALLLPEPMGRQLPQTLDDGESFGTNDTCITYCRNRI